MEKDEKFVKVGNLYHLVTSEKFGNIECSEKGFTEEELHDIFLNQALYSDPLAQDFHLKLMHLRREIEQLENLAGKLFLENDGILERGSGNFNEPFALLYRKIKDISKCNR